MDGQSDRQMGEQPTADSGTDAGIYYTEWTDRQTDGETTDEQPTADSATNAGIH